MIWTQENFNHEEDVPENENDIRKSLTLSGTGNIAQIIARENSKNIEKNRGLESRKKEESDTKSSSIDSAKLGKQFSKNNT